MPVLLWIAAAVVMAASIAFVVIGSVYKWDVRSKAYGTWTRVTGVVAVLALAALAAIARIDRPALAAAIVVGGILLSWGYVALHKRLTDRVIELLTGGDRPV